uniref:Carboxylesterase type B domain-containing protein n=1 Tax=Stegastes partitus TaxID=144197 RepID=A0A3B5AKB1_9TELE
VVRCIKGKSKDQIVAATKKVSRLMKIFLGAVVDGEFLTDTAEELLKRKEVLKVPVMMGVTNHEFGWILPQNLNLSSLPSLLQASSANNLIIDEYLKDAKTPEEIRDGFTEIIGDLLMTLPVVKVAGYHADAGAPVYMYEFVYRAQVHRDNRPSFVKADHADDVGFMFGACFWNGPLKILGNITTDDETLCRTMMSYWANFAHNGSPDGPGLVSWPQYDRQKQQYMELDLTSTVKQKLKERRVHFATVKTQNEHLRRI